MSKNDVKDMSIDDLFVLVDNHEDDSEKLAVEPYSYWKSVFRVFIRKPSSITALVILGLLLIMAIFVPIFSRYDLSTHITGADSWKYLAPSFEHFFGCDQLGRDLFLVCFEALKLSFGLAIVISLINAFTGIIIGTIWGYFRKIDAIMIEIYNFFGNIPDLLLYMLILFVLRQLGINEFVSFIFTLTVTGWLGMARFIRNQIIIINDREYNLASKTLGTSPFRIITHNLLPFILPVIVTNISLAIPAAVSMETALSFFGLGLSNTTVALGPILNLGYKNWVDYPWTLFYPALTLGLLTVSFYLLGLSLSDALDPKLHR